MIYALIAVVVILVILLMYLVYSKNTYVTPYVNRVRQYLPESFGGVQKITKLA